LTEKLETAISNFGKAKGFSEQTFRFNKATLFSWFVFLLVANKKFGIKVDPELQAQMLTKLTNLRERSLNKNNHSEDSTKTAESFLGDLFAVFEDRSRARVGNVDSVLIRDIMLWLIFLMSHGTNLEFGKDEKLQHVYQDLQPLYPSGTRPKRRWNCVFVGE